MKLSFDEEHRHAICTLGKHRDPCTIHTLDDVKDNLHTISYLLYQVILLRPALSLCHSEVSLNVGFHGIGVPGSLKKYLIVL